MNLPQGWLQVKMPDVVEWSSGGTPKSDNPKYYNGTIPWLIIGDLTDNVIYSSATKITELGMKESNAKYVEKDSVLLAMYGSIGKLGIAGVRLTTNQAIAFTKTFYGIKNRYLFYYLQLIKSKLFSLSKGGTQKNISLTVVNSLDIPLPPLPEQQRIVDKIESLFSELENGVTLLKTIKAQLAVYRQAVLKWAFEGKLTEEWRISIKRSNIEDELLKNRIDTISPQTDCNNSYLNIPSDWLWISLGDIFPIEVGATPSRRIAEYWGGDINWISSGEVKFCSIFNSREKITILGLNNASTNLQPPGTVFLAMIGEGKTRGQAAITKIPTAHNQNTAAIIVPNTIYPAEYLYYYLLYNYQNTRTVGSGNNQKALNKERVKKILIPFTTKSEQHAIVSAIESRLSVCDKLEQTIDQTLALSASLRQSILKKAFEGRLVPQDPNDESAEKLLERIKAEKTAVQAKQKQTRKRSRK